ncbi:hypothetical protein CICLE_v10033259mg [Citrus x clementina]|uniref:Uncharacterized protein n=1 Tax=Citrus clementina TaxID=85681 RepID=V4SNX3_CITCL|nr:hypothetical protein CICLE_v10033259mg [Citrus x clementina]
MICLPYYGSVCSSCAVLHPFYFRSCGSTDAPNGSYILVKTAVKTHTYISNYLSILLFLYSNINLLAVLVLS